MKAYTDLEQSKKLTEILPLESADMRFCFSHTLGGRIKGHYPMIGREPSMGTIPCWSLAALLSVLPKQVGRYTKTLYWFDDAWHCEYVDEDSESKYGVTEDNPVDACYEMILELKEKYLL